MLVGESVVRAREWQNWKGVVGRGQELFWQKGPGGAVAVFDDSVTQKPAEKGGGVPRC